MAESIVQVTEGVGKKLHTWSRVVGANTVEDEFVVPGEYPLASYNVAPSAANIAIATNNSHIMQLMAGAALNVRIRRIRMWQSVVATTLAFYTFELLRLTTAGTGGTVLTPSKLDNGDAAAGAAGMTLPTVKGTEGAPLDTLAPTLVAAATAGQNLIWEWTQHPGMKPIIIPAGVANGICLKNTVAAAAGAIRVVIEFVETSFL
jgi:hypothetical protein